MTGKQNILLACSIYFISSGAIEVLSNADGWGGGGRGGTHFPGKSAAKG